MFETEPVLGLAPRGQMSAECVAITDLMVSVLARWAAILPTSDQPARTAEAMATLADTMATITALTDQIEGLDQ